MSIIQFPAVVILSLAFSLIMSDNVTFWYSPNPLIILIARIISKKYLEEFHEIFNVGINLTDGQNGLLLWPSIKTLKDWNWKILRFIFYFFSQELSVYIFQYRTFWNALYPYSRKNFAALWQFNYEKSSVNSVIKV